MSSWVMVSCVICVALTQCVHTNDVRDFPDGFIFGTSTASYQVEGAWDADGKTENIWDRLTHTQPELVKDLTNGDDAAKSYFLYERDVQMTRELGVDYYRFSLSWNRILPSGFSNKINEEGVRHYNNLIDELLKYNIKPMVTLYHCDLPQRLQDLGGWANPDIATWFGDYARTVFTLFGDRVKYFITINEPQRYCYYGYAQNLMAPALDFEGIADYMCAKNSLLAHAKAYHIYDKEFRSTQNGTIFISLSADWFEPASDSVADMEAADNAIQFEWAQFTWPIFSKTGNFPPAMRKRIAEKSFEQGYSRSRLPELTQEEIELIKGSSDIFGLNHYSSYYVYRNASVSTDVIPSFADDLEVGTYQLPEWQIGASNYTMSVPWGFRKVLNRIKDDYNNPPVFITENGFGTYGGLIDDDRIEYHRGYMGSLLDALDDGCDIRAYTIWSLMDNFEWTNGYMYRFGLYEVDYDSVYRTRTARKMAYVYKEILRTRQLDLHYEPDLSRPITIDDGH